MLKKRLRCCLSVLAVLLCSTGCASQYALDYTEEEQDVIADYIAAAVMKHDKKMKMKYRYGSPTEEKETEQQTTEEETTKEQMTSSVQQESTKPADTASKGELQEETTSAQAKPEVSTAQKLTEALDLGGLKAEYLDYQLTPSYPESNSQHTEFVMQAVENTKLLVVKFRLSNPTAEPIALNMLERNRRFKAVINENYKVTVQLSLLLDALNTYEGTFQPGESRDLVLVYQVRYDKKEDIQSLDVVLAGSDGKETTVRLK